MATKTPHSKRGARRRSIVLISLVALAGAVCAGAVAAGTQRPAADAAARAEGSYGWPLVPFDRPHPVRGVFGDPRTRFNGPPTRAGLNGGGTFSYHFGVDISAPAGTRVYPVCSGVAHLRSRETVVVRSGDDAFEYWHIVPAVREGQQITAFQTVLGRIRPGEYEHVHLTELRGGRPVNPLAPGHLTPYNDPTTPRVDSARFLTAAGRDLVPEWVHGRVQLAVGATDQTSLPVPGRWNGLPVTPARITWHVEQAKDGRVVVSEREAYDVRQSLPQAPFWQSYVRGTRQNMASFCGHKMWRQPGVYLFRLASSFDSRCLKDGVYVLVVTASDTRGNAGTGRFVFTVHNNPAFFGA